VRCPTGSILATASEDDLLVGLRLRQRHQRPLIDQLRDAAASGVDTLTIHRRHGQLAIGVTGREHAAAGG
jgi:hypothetical protein